MNVLSILILFYSLTAFVLAGDENLMFKPYENVYVVNLNSRPDRLAFMTDVLNEIEQPFTRIEAINGKELIESCKEKPLSLHPQILYTCNDFYRDYENKTCKAGEIGCWLSHLKIYIQIVENYEKTGKDNPTVILEDDTDLDVNFKELVNNSFSKLPSDWEVFYLGYFWPSEIRRLQNNIAFAPHFAGSFAYVIRNAEVAKKFISYSNKSTCQIADFINLFAIQRGELRGYLAYPQHYVSYNPKLGQDIHHGYDKDGPVWVAKLKDSTQNKIMKRKNEI